MAREALCEQRDESCHITVQWPAEHVKYQLQ